MAERKLAVREVLAAVYPPRYQGSMLTHLVIDGYTSTERVGCRRVRIDHLCDERLDGPPTCPVCRRRWDRLTRPQAPAVRAAVGAKGGGT